MAATPDIPPRERRQRVKPFERTRDQARDLRATMSKPEVYLWTKLSRARTGFKFNRQKPLGPYIADFYCHKALLVVEIDGEIHRNHIDHDRARDTWMRERGIEVLRIPARDVFADLAGTAERVAIACRRRIASLTTRRTSPVLEDSATPSGSPEGDRRDGVREPNAS
jgi:very-short-patch-repair endonuclease